MKKSFSSESSSFKLVIYLQSGEIIRRYSFLKADKNGSSNFKLERLLLTTYKNKYTTALLYDNKTDQELVKWVNGIKIFDNRKLLER